MPCWSRETAQAAEQAVQDMLAGRKESYSCEYDCRLRGSDDWRRFAMQVRPLAVAGARMLIMSHDDITERRLAETEHKTLERRMKQLGARMESIREEQTAVIARELHDELGALLTMLRLDMAITAEKVIRPKWMRVKLGQFVEQVHAALAVVKRISSDLRPATLDTLGLIATIRWYLNQFSQSTGIAATLRLPEYVRLSDISNIAVFRVIQETLTNVATHAGATQVTVVVSKQVDKLVVDISDNGKGICEKAKRKPDSYGILGMRERAAYLGGTLSISSEPGRGTRLVLEIPLDG
jgi:signal transduction histidine kinase